MGKHDRRTTNYFSVLDESYEPNSPVNKRGSPQQQGGFLVQNDEARDPEHRGEDAHGDISTGFASIGSIKTPRPGVSNRSGNDLGEDIGSAMESAANSAKLRSPDSPDNLNFKNLNIISGDVGSHSGNLGRHQTLFQRGSRTNNDANFSNYGPARQDYPQHNSVIPYSHRGHPNMDRPAYAWMSADAHAHQQYMVVRNSMRRQFKHSDVAKWKVPDYVAHREAMVESQAKALARKAESKPIILTAPIEATGAEIQQKLFKFGLKRGQTESHANLGSVLGEQTIWCKDWMVGKDEIAPWPSLAELKWEGDDRAKTGVGRFLPLPREEGPPGLPWNQLPVVDQYPMDQIALIPTLEDIYLPVDPHIEEDKEYLWSKDLEAAIDEYLDT